MATATPPQPGSEDTARIVGDRLEADLVEVGMTRPAARAVHRALEERFAAIDRRFDAIDRRLDAMDRRFDRQDSAIAELRREMRWGFGILFTAIIGLTIALLARGL